MAANRTLFFMAIGAVGAELMEGGNLSVEYHQNFLIVVVVGLFLPWQEARRENSLWLEV